HVLSLARWRFVTEAAPAKGADPVRGLLGRGQDTFGDLGLFGGKEPARLELVIVSPDSAVFLVSPDPTELLPRSAVRVDTELAANCLERDERRLAHGTCLGFRASRTSLALDCRLLLGNASPGFRLRNGGLLLSHCLSPFSLRGTAPDRVGPLPYDSNSTPPVSGRSEEHTSELQSRE